MGIKNKKKQFIFMLMLALCIMACGKGAQTAEDSGSNEDEAAEEVRISTGMTEDEMADFAISFLYSFFGIGTAENETPSEPKQEIEQEAESEQTLPDNVIVAYVSEDIEYVDEVIPVQYTDDLSLLADMKYTNSTYAYQDGKVYYRRYHEDSYEEAALWGSYGTLPDKEKEIICIDADGKETILFTDKGYGGIYLLNNRFYMTDEVTDENGDIRRMLYSVDMQGNDRFDYGEGYVSKVDRERKIIKIRLWGDGYYALNYETGEREQVYYSGVYQDGWFSYVNHSDDDDICKLCAVSLDGEEREIIALTSDGNQIVDGREHILDIKVDGDRVYFIFGGYLGQLQVFQGGKLISVKLDGTDYKAVETHSDNYYICHDEGKTLVYFSERYNGDVGIDGEPKEYSALVWDVEEDICYCSEFPGKDLFCYEEMGPLYSVSRYDDELQRRRVDFYAIPDDSSRIVRIVMDIEQYITKWEEEEADYIDYGDYYFADGFLYFTVEYNAYDAETSLGWRDGYRRLHTDIYRLKIGEDKAEVLYSY